MGKLETDFLIRALIRSDGIPVAVDPWHSRRACTTDARAQGAMLKRETKNLFFRANSNSNQEFNARTKCGVKTDFSRESRALCPVECARIAHLDRQTGISTSDWNIRAAMSKNQGVEAFIGRDLEIGG